MPFSVHNADETHVLGRNGGGWALKQDVRKPQQRKKNQRALVEDVPDEEEDEVQDSEKQDRRNSSARSQYSSRSQVAGSSRESTPGRSTAGEVGRSSIDGRGFVVRDDDDDEEGGWAQMVGQ